MATRAGRGENEFLILRGANYREAGLSVNARGIFFSISLPEADRAEPGAPFPPKLASGLRRSDTEPAFYTMKNWIAPRLALLTLLAPLALTPAPAHEAASQMAELASAFLGALTPEQQAVARFPMDSDERENWHFIPRERLGLTMSAMTPQQRLLAQALLTTGLSADGVRKALTIMSLEEILWEMEGAGQDEEKRGQVRERRDPLKYHLSIFGDPGPEGAWGWRVEGHHLSLNFTIKDGRLLRATPAFFGSNPGEVRQGPLSGLRVLGVEEECGRSLAKALTPQQLAKARISNEAPKDILTSAERKVSPLEPDGLSELEMTVGQQAMLHRLIREYLDRARPEIAEATWAEIRAAGKIHFAWAGGLELGEPHYYRVQGPTFLLEYDNVQNDANHVHCVWRSFDGDFGRDILAEHHRAGH
jgi:hypothetical protein